MTQDLALTATGLVGIVLGQERYPLLFPIARMKEWAEHRQQTLETVLHEGWKVEDLSEADIRMLLTLALKGGEARRALFEGGQKREITDELVNSVLDVVHADELMGALIRVWNHRQVDAPDPPAAESPSPGD
jgi:hypothetical protein